MEKIISSSVSSFPKVLELLERLPKEIVNLCDAGEAIIVGGAFRSIFSNENPNDIDIFIKDRNTFLDIVKKFGAVLDEESSGARCLFNGLKFDFQWTYGYQLNQVLDLSDITISQIGYIKKLLFFNEDFFSQIEVKEFSLTGLSLNPEKTKERICKYEEYGFHVSQKNK